MNIKEKLKQDFVEDGHFEPYALTEIANWPTIFLENEDEDNNELESEPLDLENCEVVELGERDMTIIGGGDWQMPHRVEIILNDNDELEVVSCHPLGEDEEYEDGLNISEELELEED